MRGIGLVAVLLYHGGYTILPGAYFSISMFFTLSGFLITMLMIKEVAKSDRIALGAFWLRRARRLLPGRARHPRSASCCCAATSR